MPTATDLVTDLPADFAVFGQAVDTSMAGLLGGTTGQILSKTSGTNMAFTWVSPNPGDITGVTAGTGISGGGTSGDVTVTNSMATAITTSGDLIQGTGSGTFARLGTGTAGQFLTTNGTTNSWGTPAAGSMTLISTTSLSGASVTISSIPTTYNDLYMYLTNVRPVTDGANITMAFNADNTANRHGEDDFANSVGTFNGTNTQIMPAIDDTVTTGNFWIKIPNYTNTSIWKFAEIQGLGANNTTPTSYTTWWYHALYNQTAAITSLKFAPNTGNFNAGTVLLYGVK
jgi:hypothetical protein